jgi:hypothetical protein
MDTTITYKEEKNKDKKGRMWLITVIDYMKNAEYIDLFEKINIKMKRVNYSVKQKVLTIICSIAVGCEYTKDINNKLVPDEVSAKIIGMERFPDQSQINILLRKFDRENINELKQIQIESFHNNSLSLSIDEPKIIDIDQSGLIANGKTYELTEKGYFPKKKNQKGYKISASYLSNSKETLSLYLEKGNTDEFENMKNVLKDIKKFFVNEPLRNIIVRADAGYGSKKGIELLKKK